MLMSEGVHDGRVAVVTGGANGIGREIALRLADDGADVAVLDVADAEHVAAKLEHRSGRALAVFCDVTDEASVAQAAMRVTDELGSADILVNNVGVYPYDDFAEIDLATWRRVMAVNLDSVFIVSSAFVPAMRARGWGRIVNMASNTFHGGKYPSYVHYIASKGGVVGFTRGLASALGADGITVNAIVPGLTRTDTMIASRPPDLFDKVVATQSIARSQEPADVAGAVSFLASDAAGFITGQTLPVDGGVARV
jgi:NAD(P)-dependent dehydrogenase (short-subunit alcohol dehydrogenase family)